jgi:hypothetical protein
MEAGSAAPSGGRLVLVIDVPRAKFLRGFAVIIKAFFTLSSNPRNTFLTIDDEGIADGISGPPLQPTN